MEKTVHCIHRLDMKGWIWRASCTWIHHHHMSVTITPEPGTTCKKRGGQQAKWPSHNAGVRAHFASDIKLEYGIFVIQFFPDIEGLSLPRAEHITLVSGNLEAVCPVSLFSMTFLETEKQGKKIGKNCEKPGKGAKWRRRQEGNVCVQFVFAMLLWDLSLANMVNNNSKHFLKESIYVSSWRCRARCKSKEHRKEEDSGQCSWCFYRSLYLIHLCGTWQLWKLGPASTWTASEFICVSTAAKK